MIDMHLEARMPLGDLPEHRNRVSGYEKTQTQVRFFARFPEPVEGAVGQPCLLMRFAEAVAKSEHGGRAFAPARDDVLAIRALQVEIAKDAELVGMAPRRFDGVSVDRLAECAWRVDHRAIHSRRFHLRQRI